MTKLQTWKGERRQQADRRRAHAAQGATAATTAPASARPRRRATPSSCTRGDGKIDHPGREHRARDRLAADRDPGLQVRRQAHRRLDRRARASTHVPERLVVIGGGYIGLELGMVYAKFGAQGDGRRGAARDPRRQRSRDCVAVVARKLKKMGVEVMTDAKAKSGRTRATARSLTVERQGRQGRHASTPTRSCVVGRPPPEQRGPRPRGGRRRRSSAASSPSTSSCAPTSPASTRSATSSASRCSRTRRRREAEVVAEVIAGHKAAFDVRTIPAVIFTDPEIASAGLTADEAKARRPQGQGRQVPVRRARPRAIVNADTDGFVKVVDRRRDRRRCSASTSSATAPADIIAEARAGDRDGRGGRRPQPDDPRRTRRCPRRSWRPRRRAWAKRSTFRTGERDHAPQPRLASISASRDYARRVGDAARAGDGSASAARSRTRCCSSSTRT